MRKMRSKGTFSRPLMTVKDRTSARKESPKSENSGLLLRARRMAEFLLLFYFQRFCEGMSELGAPGVFSEA
jgi:hypothetical protein